MIVFKTDMKELPLSCSKCDLSVDMCKYPRQILKHKNSRYKYCPLIEIDQTVIKDEDVLTNELIFDKEDKKDIEDIEDK